MSSRKEVIYKVLRKTPGPTAESPPKNYAVWRITGDPVDYASQKEASAALLKPSPTQTGATE